MAQNESSKISYFNTLIFTIISGIISLLLLLTLFFDIGKKYAYLVIGVEVGIFIIIGVCIIQIINNEKKLKNMKKLSSDKISFSQCPDYFMKVENNNVINCNNDFIVTTADGKQQKLKIYPADPSITMPNSLPVNNPDVKDTFPLFYLEQSTDLKDATQQCNIVINEPNPANTSIDFQNKFKGYSKLPWTYAKSRCSPYVE